MAKLRPASIEHILGIDLAESQLTLIMQLVAMRKAKNLTQEQVARRMGLPDHSAVSKFENSINADKQPQLSTIKRYAEAVEAYVAYFVTDGTIDSRGKKAYEQTLRALRRNLDLITDRARNSTEDTASQEFRLALGDSANGFVHTLSFNYPAPQAKSPHESGHTSRFKMDVKPRSAIAKGDPVWASPATWRDEPAFQGNATEKGETCQV